MDGSNDRVRTKESSREKVREEKREEKTRTCRERKNYISENGGEIERDARENEWKMVSQSRFVTLAHHMKR
jgi:hypothetical protein